MMQRENEQTHDVVETILDSSPIQSLARQEARGAGFQKVLQATACDARAGLPTVSLTSCEHNIQAGEEERCDAILYLGDRATANLKRRIRCFPSMDSMHKVVARRKRRLARQASRIQVYRFQHLLLVDRQQRQLVVHFAA